MCLKIFGILVAVFSIVLGVFYATITQPPPAVDTSAILKEGGKFIKLRDGRILEYFESGVADGLPLVLVPGSLTTAKQFVAKQDIWEKHNIRAIGVSIPGYGYSDTHHRRKLPDFAIDVSELVDHLKLEKFRIAGYSFGAMHAAAVASAMPDRIESLGLFSAATSVVENVTIPWEVVLKYRILGAPVLCDIICYFSAAQVKNGEVEALISQTPKDYELFKKIPTEDREVLVADMIRSLSVTYRGLTDTFRLMAVPFGFSLQPISQIKKVIVSSGDIDETAPGMQKMYKDQIPNAKWIEYKGLGHFHVVPHFEELIVELL